jgi:hypothetical protein
MVVTGQMSRKKGGRRQVYLHFPSPTIRWDYLVAELRYLLYMQDDR